MNLPVMFIDDEKSVRDALGQTLELEDYDVSLFASAKPALDLLTPLYQGVIISDINMPGIDGLQFLKQAIAIDPELSIIMLTGHGDISMAVDAMRMGAYDFLEKPFSTDNLLDVVKRASDKRQLVLENRELRRELEVQSAPGPRILGNSPSIKQLRRMLSHLNQSAPPLLIHGESGAGKSLVARFSHDHSPRQGQPFITVNADTDSPHQLGLDLFGSAEQGGAGLFEQAQGGTLYVKHLDKLPESLQQPFLSHLNRCQHSTTGECPQAYLNVRVIASLSGDKKQQGSDNPFYQAIYFQHNFVSLELPPLRQRKEDISILFHNFLRADCSRFGIEPASVSPELEQQLLNHRWNNNVRELRTFAERFILMGEQASLFSPTSIHSDSPQEPATLADRVSQFESKLLRDALNRHHGRLKDVQQELGLARKTLYDKMKKHGIDKGEFKQ